MTSIEKDQFVAFVMPTSGYYLTNDTISYDSRYLQQYPHPDKLTSVLNCSFNLPLMS